MKESGNTLLHQTLLMDFKTKSLVLPMDDLLASDFDLKIIKKALK